MILYNVAPVTSVSLSRRRGKGEQFFALTIIVDSYSRRDVMAGNFLRL